MVTLKMPMINGEIIDAPMDWEPPEPEPFYAHDYLTVVRLHGSLAEAAGFSRIELMVESVAEVIRALHWTSDKRTTQHIAETGEKVRWRVLVDGDLIRGDRPWNEVESDLRLARPMREIDIYPVVEGADAGWWQILLGAALIVVGVIITVVTFGGFGPAWAALTTGQLGFWGTIGMGIALAGLSAVLGGLSSLIFGAEAFDASGEESKNKPSYLFSGAVNTMRQGGPVPVLYGQMIVGSQLISAGLHTVAKDKEKDSNFPTNRYSAVLLNEGEVEDWGDPQTWTVTYPAWYTDAMAAYVAKPEWIACYDPAEYQWLP